MSIAQVYNDNTFPFVEDFKGEKIRIEPKGFIEMEFEDAVEFKSQYFPPQYDGSGNQKPESYKMIRLEGERRPDNSRLHVCSCCGDSFGTEADLLSHIEKNHLDQMEDQKVANKLRKKGK